MCRFTEKESNEPRLTQKQISKQLAYSDSTTKRYKDFFKLIVLIIETDTGRKIMNQTLQ